MIKGKKIVCVIPARLHSTRFPQKILAILAGRPLLESTWRAACSVPFFDEVLIGVDSEEVGRVVSAFGGRWVLTSSSCQNGTERLIEIQSRGIIEGDVWVNWQADEPFLSPAIMEDLLQSCSEEGEDLWTLKTLLTEEKRGDPSICKVVTDYQGFALYFSRSPIPYRREVNALGKTFRHIGLYAYSDRALKAISSLPSCEIEESEMLEQLRFLYYGLRIRVHETVEESIGIDLPEHLPLAEAYAKKLGLFV